MRKKLVLVLWLGSVVLEAAEIIVRSRRTLGSLRGDTPWRNPPWGGGGFWNKGG